VTGQLYLYLLHYFLCVVYAEVNSNRRE
jgi:hypothetical protein